MIGSELEKVSDPVRLALPSWRERCGRHGKAWEKQWQAEKPDSGAGRWRTLDECAVEELSRLVTVDVPLML